MSTPKKATDAGIFRALCGLLAAMEMPVVSKELRRIVGKYDKKLLALVDDLSAAHKAAVLHVRREGKR